MSFSLNGRTFVPIENSRAGVVDERTKFHFSQTDIHFQARYSGGDILHGHIIGHFSDAASGALLYHCETNNGTLKAGRADAQFAEKSNGMLTMSLRWEWLSGANGSGTSKYVEISEATP